MSSFNLNYVFNIKFESAWAMVKKLDLVHSSLIKFKMSEVFQDYQTIKLYNGNLTIDDNFHIDEPMIINGDLIIRKYLTDINSELNNFVFVTGNVYCNNFISRANFFIGGSLSVRNCLVLDSYGNHVLIINNDLSARLVIGLGHMLEVEGDIRNDTLFFGEVSSTNELFSDHSSKLMNSILEDNKEFLPILLDTLQN